MLLLLLPLSLAVWSWVAYLTSLGLSFSSVKWGQYPSQGCCEGKRVRTQAVLDGYTVLQACWLYDDFTAPAVIISLWLVQHYHHLPLGTC